MPRIEVKMLNIQIESNGDYILLTIDQAKKLYQDLDQLFKLKTYSDLNQYKPEIINTYSFKEDYDY